ncbi:MAG: hypothetical protein V1916_03290, partial [Patescibacteria group bacterium]
MPPTTNGRGRPARRTAAIPAAGGLGVPSHPAERHYHVSGLPDLTSQSLFVATHPSPEQRVIFWVLTAAELAAAERLLRYWYTVLKIPRAVWLLDAINPPLAAGLAEGVPQTVLANVATLNGKFPSLAALPAHQLTLCVSQQVSPAQLSQKLVSFGYDFVTQASQAGTFSRRGGVMDIYPLASGHPVRLEFDGNTLTSISTYNLVSKRAAAALGQLTVTAYKFMPSCSR